MNSQQAKKNNDKDTKKQLSTEEMRRKLMGYEVKRWQESRGKFVEFDIKTMNKYKKYYDDIAEINPNPENDGMGTEQLEEPFISLGLAYTREEVDDLIQSVDDDGSGKIEFDEFLRIIHNKSKKKAKGNEKITNFFKDLANNNISQESDLNHFSFKTIMGILRRNNLLKAFKQSNDMEKAEGEKMLKAYSVLLDKKK
jgi:Ca2+-binding EF-hand superfamily protein